MTSSNSNVNTNASIFQEVETLARQTSSKYMKISPGEQVVLQFNPDRAEIIEREFNGKKSKAVQYEVLTPQGESKMLTLSLSWALNLNELLKEGHTKVKVGRRGGGLQDTRYAFLPVSE
jgi:hypothetical protein